MMFLLCDVELSSSRLRLTLVCPLYRDPDENLPTDVPVLHQEEQKLS